MTNFIKPTASYMRRGVFSLFLILFSLFISFFCSKSIGEYVILGLSLCKNVIIGSVFPFMILSDYISSTLSFDSNSFFGNAFERIFNINRQGVSSFIIGIICGFPLGAKSAYDLYKDGRISLDECERLISFSNNTGPAFIVSGIGIAMRNSFLQGIILYFSMVFSAIIVGFFIGRGKKASFSANNYNNRSFNFVDSVKSSASNTLNVCAFIVFFSVITGFMKIIINNDTILAFLYPFIEISNASRALSYNISSPNLSLILTSFAISFSGLSVHMQARSIITDRTISMRQHFIAKFMQGLIAAIITSIIIVL